MKIRFLIANAYAVGGTIKTTYNLAGELAKRHDVEIVSLQKKHDAPAFPVPPNVRVRALVDWSPQAQLAERQRTGFVNRAKRKLKAWARRRPSRLIHPGDFRYKNFNLLTDVRLLAFLWTVNDGVLIGTRAGLNLAIARFARRSVIRVGQEHLNMTKYRDDIRASFREHYPRLDAYSALTERDAAAFSQLLDDGTRVACIPNGVSDIGRVRSDTASKVVIAAGRLTPQKGFDRLVIAWEQVAERYPDWELRLFGGGKLKRRLERRIQEAGLAGSARLMGYTDNLPEEMAQGAFYVMSSRFEGFPMVLLEAMRCGLPIVSFDCPNGPRDLITHGEDGFLVPDGDVDGLAAAMIEMIELGSARRSFGEAALRKSQQYELPAIADRWEELLEDLASERPQRRGRWRPRPAPERSRPPG